MGTKENRRLAALLGYRILDTDPERGFDDLALLASQICEAPIALISLVDAHRQWFKARVGLSASETSRSVAFCSHAIEQSDLFIVHNALDDARFRDNPLVVSEPHIRFYAGAPLVNPEGHALGTLCVIDLVPRTLNASQREALSALRRQVVAQLELRKNLIELRQTLRERDQAEAEQGRLIEKLRESLDNVKKLSGMIPLCSACKFDMTIPEDLSAISTVAEGVMHVLENRNWARGGEFNIETALREALANAIRHGCKSDSSKKVQCCLTCDESGEVLIVVRDPGPGFEFASVPNPLEEKNLIKPSGRGVFLINELMDEVHFADEGREIRMRKRAGPKPHE